VYRDLVPRQVMDTFRRSTHWSAWLWNAACAA